MPECRDTVTGFFQDDHRRLDDVFERYEQAKNGGEGDPLVHFDEFAEGLRRHIAWEEDHLFPLFEQRTGMGLGGPTEVMRREHRQIERLLDDIAEGLRDGVLDALGESEEVLTDLLAQHNVKEEQVLYPSIDNLLSEDDSAELFARLRGG
jgi:hemerythrin-like domain-containing protein